MNIMVTGGAGFIGSAFVRLLVRLGYKVCVIDKLTYAGDLRRLNDVLNDIAFYQADVQNEEFMSYIFKRERPDIIVHFAAETHVDRSILSPDEFLKTNIMGTKVLMDLSLRLHKIRKFINISTDEVYGEIKQGNFHEDSPLSPNSPYAVSKASQDMLGRAYHRTYDLPVITLRISNNYGPFQHPEKLIPLSIYKALMNQKIPLYGDGLNVREWLYVEDCAEAILQVMEKGRVGEIYNIGSGEEKTNLEVVKIILDVLNKDYHLIEFVRDRPGHDYRYALSTEKIKIDIGWTPKVRFRDGIEKTIEWYIKHMYFLTDKAKDLREFWKA